jgi:hypothetical protein
MAYPSPTSWGFALSASLSNSLQYIAASLSRALNMSKDR